jgi:hypothetical protein
MCAGKCHFGVVNYPDHQEPFAWFNDGSPVKTAHFVSCQYCGLNSRGITGGYQTQELAAHYWNVRESLSDEHERIAGYLCSFWSASSLEGDDVSVTIKIKVPFLMDEKTTATILRSIRGDKK